jgi:hypothetical protein
MPKLSPDDRLAALVARKAKLQRRIDGLKSRNQKQVRALDARRKIIAGALALEHYGKNPDSEFGRVMFRLLDEYARPEDRRLFDFLPQQEAEQVPPTPDFQAA